jgi:hypothetical protein
MCSTGHTFGSVGIHAESGRRARRAVGDLWPRSRPSQTYLVVFDGDDWPEVVPIRARGATEIAIHYPEATVLHRRPVWMSVQEYERLRCEGRDLDQRPSVSA